MSSRAEAPRLCSKCGKNPRVPYQRWCAECRREYLRVWRKTHPDSTRKWYARQPEEIKEVYRAKQRARYQACKDDPEKATEMAAYQGAYRQVHREKLLKQMKEWRRVQKCKNQVSTLPQDGADTASVP